MFFSIPWIYVVDISKFYFEEYMLGYLLVEKYEAFNPASCGI